MCLVELSVYLCKAGLYKISIASIVKASFRGSNKSIGSNKSRLCSMDKLYKYAGVYVIAPLCWLVRTDIMGTKMFNAD